MLTQEKPLIAVCLFTDVKSDVEVVTEKVELPK